MRGMKSGRGLAGLLLGCMTLLLAGGAAPSATPGPLERPWLDTARSVDERASALLAAMTLDEKIGQMTQLELGSVDPAMITRLDGYAVLSRLRARGVKVVLCDYSGARWAGIARRHGAKLVPARSCYDSASRGFDGLHMNRAGHRTVAARLEPIIRSLL